MNKRWIMKMTMIAMVIITLNSNSEAAITRYHSYSLPDEVYVSFIKDDLDYQTYQLDQLMTLYIANSKDYKLIQKNYEINSQQYIIYKKSYDEYEQLKADYLLKRQESEASGNTELTAQYQSLYNQTAVKQADIVYNMELAKYICDNESKLRNNDERTKKNEFLSKLYGLLSLQAQLETLFKERAYRYTIYTSEKIKYEKNIITQAQRDKAKMEIYKLDNRIETVSNILKNRLEYIKSETAIDTNSSIIIDFDLTKVNEYDYKKFETALAKYKTTILESQILEGNILAKKRYKDAISSIELTTNSQIEFVNLEIQKLTLEKEAAEISLEQQLFELKNKYNELTIQYQNFIDEVRVSHKLIYENKVKYDKGLISKVDLQLAEMDKKNAEVNLYDAISHYLTLINSIQ